MRLWAISDLHLGYEKNMEALMKLRVFPSDGLILGGDLCETPEQLLRALQILKEKFTKLFWVPGNHELWTMSESPTAPRGHAKYMQMIDVCRSLDVSTPEDDYVRWKTPRGEFGIVPLFLLYDYSYRPSGMSVREAIAWADEEHCVCADEFFLHPTPYESREKWCEVRCNEAYERLKQLPKDLPLVVVNHYPLREELVRIPRIPRFRLWCGTQRTENWHREFNIAVAVSGHLHFRNTDWIDGVRFEEVSLGYPNQWRQEKGLEPYLRQILPGGEENE